MIRPIVGISCCVKQFGPNHLPNHAAPDASVQAISQHADAIPVLLPALGERCDINTLLSRLDGLLFTGSRSMVCSSHYGGPALADGTPVDHARDATTLPLIRAALARGVPVLAICRGFQELNVALGGTLHQDLAALPGRDGHAPRDGDWAVKIAKRHHVHLAEGGLLRRLAGVPRIAVNSLHHQGVDVLAPSLAVEATAEDGTIEAVRLAGGGGFMLGVQWHPEFDCHADEFSRRVFELFGTAIRAANTMAMAAD
jgi:putative glutamine amidotransferase